MSKYENYDKISLTYDETRKAVGIEIILGFLASLSKPLHDLCVLDAGCGTGNYALKLREKIGCVVCADLSFGMLKQAKRKFSHHGFNETELVQCDISELPFQDNLFDAIICNQSLHHLDQPEQDFPNQQRFLEQAVQKLKPEGLLIINTITHEQLRDGVWWGELIKPAVDRMTNRFTSLAKLEQLLARCELKITNRVVPIDTIIQEKGYFDPNSLRREEFRNGDSHFSLLTSHELNNMLTQLDRLEADGNIHNYIMERDKLRMQLGQFTFFVARKTSHGINIKEKTNERLP